MRYYAQYQYRPTGRDRPLDEGMMFDITSENGELILLPNVGDYISISGEGGLRGIVETRMFSYAVFKDNPKETACIINVVVGDTDTNWGRLIKE